MNEHPLVSRLVATNVRRDGVTVIEVMTAMLVALIGVFGVLVLIPFSVQQAQIGLDQDAATLVAQNVVEEMQLRGYLQVQENGDLNLRGLRIDTTGNPVAMDPTQPRDRNVPGTVTAIAPINVYGSAGVVNARRPVAFHFDPIAVSNVGYPALMVNQPNARNPDCFNLANNANLLRNPDFLTRYLPASRNDLRLPVVTAVNGLTTDFDTADNDPLTNPELVRPELIGIREADRIFRSLDDLVWGDQDNFPGDAIDVSDVDLPQPVFDVSAGGRVVRRQSSGRVSWSAVFVPEKGSTVKPTAALPATATNRYRVYVLVYKDRSVLAGRSNPTLADATEDDGESQMFAALVARATLANAAAMPVDRNFGFEQAVDQIHVQFADPTDLTDFNPTSLAGVRKDDWVMLINRKPVPDYVGQTGLPIRVIAGGVEIETDEPGYDLQVGFARVTGVRDVPADPMRNPFGRGVINVEGGGFNFFYDDVRSGQLGIPVPSGSMDPGTDTDTYVIHLQNVVTVYERTITLEQNSSWN